MFAQFVWGLYHSEGNTFEYEYNGNVNRAKVECVFGSLMNGKPIQ